MAVFSKLKAARGLVFTLFLFFATVGSLVVLNPAPGFCGGKKCYYSCKQKCDDRYDACVDRRGYGNGCIDRWSTCKNNCEGMCNW